MQLEQAWARNRWLPDAASLLYRIGVTVLYYGMPNIHLMAHSRIDGKPWEILICALIASFKNKTITTRKIGLEYNDILSDADFVLIESSVYY